MILPPLVFPALVVIVGPKLTLICFVKAAEEQDEESLAEQYRGTPPLRTKKKKQLHRYSHEVTEQVDAT